MDIIAGIDIGGTRIKAAAYDSLGRQLASTTNQGEALCGGDWLENVRLALRELEIQTGSAIHHVGLAAPGLAARDGRSIVDMPGRLHGLVGLDWTIFLDRPHAVRVLNDAHAALLGEVWIGAGQGVRDCFMLTLGTGVGGAILSDGTLVRGHLGRAGHLGHISLDVYGAPDIVRTPGSLEDAIGNHNIVSRSGGRFATTQDLLVAVAANDLVAAEIWEKSVRALGVGIASLINILDPEIVILGGGIMLAGEQLLTPLKAVLAEVEWILHSKSVRLVSASLGDMAGTCGAAAYAAEHG